MNQDYIEELIILTVVGSILLVSKVIACCFSLGLWQKHKSISLRRDSLSLAKLNHLESGRIGRENIELPIICTCSKNPERNTSFQVSPKLELPEPCGPVLSIPQKHLVSVSFKEITD
jgi:hypothetical protein